MSKQQPCHFFAKGTCRNGSSCRFSHNLNQKSVSSRVSSGYSDRSIFSYSQTSNHFSSQSRNPFISRNTSASNSAFSTSSASSSSLLSAGSSSFQTPPQSNPTPFGSSQSPSSFAPGENPSIDPDIMEDRMHSGAQSQSVFGSTFGQSSQSVGFGSPSRQSLQFGLQSDVQSQSSSPFGQTRFGQTSSSTQMAFQSSGASQIAFSFGQSSLDPQMSSPFVQSAFAQSPSTASPFGQTSSPFGQTLPQPSSGASSTFGKVPPAAGAFSPSSVVSFGQSSSPLGSVFAALEEKEAEKLTIPFESSSKLEDLSENDIMFFFGGNSEHIPMYAPPKEILAGDLPPQLKARKDQLASDNLQFIHSMAKVVLEDLEGSVGYQQKFSQIVKTLSL